MSRLDVPQPTRAPTRAGRLLGIDVARAVAQLGMLIAHYTYYDGSGGDLRGVTRFVNGKAMPLFVLLGGLGFTLLSRRAAHPVAQVLGRAAVLLALGLVLVEHAPYIAVVLHFYAAFFVLGLVVRHLPNAALLVLAGVVMMAGAYTWLHVAPGRARYGGWQGWSTLHDVRPLVMDLLVTGSYPVLPTFAFFLVGMWAGRLALDRHGIQVALFVGGLALALIGLVGGEIVTRATTDRTFTLPAEQEARVGLAVARKGESHRAAVRAVAREQERATGDVPVARLVDPVGHGKMPAWVLGATGCALAVLGGSLLAFGRWPVLLRPVAMAGQLALTFYVAQGLGLRWWYRTGVDGRSYTTELVACLAIFGAFIALATLWRRRFARGPLEELLRVAGNVAAALAPSRPR
jgi:uncharacterized membrane protein YeiB